MPTVLKIGSYRFYFYSHEPNEPPHVHVDKDAYSVKFWLEPVALAENTGMSRKDLNEIQRLAIKNQKQLLEKWYAFFGAQKR